MKFIVFLFTALLLVTTLTAAVPRSQNEETDRQALPPIQFNGGDARFTAANRERVDVVPQIPGLVALWDFVQRRDSWQTHNLFYLHRTNSEGTFEAIFSAVLSVDGQTATGTLVNTSGMHGMMLMVRREALSRYKHLLESDTAQQTELAGTKPPSGAGVDDIPQGVEALEAALNEERMAQAVEMFEKLDKNKDGKITDQEVPPAQFQKNAWVQANLNGDMILTWEEELIWQYNFQKKKAGESK